jgi:hypoxanthine phosphoribosyltransferase
MKPLIAEKDIWIKTKILAKKISDRHRGDKTPVVLIGLLNGCFMFYSDLARSIDIDIECDFMRVKSYISKHKQGDIQITKDLETAIKGKHVYLIDDIYDTGNTMKAVAEYLEVKKPTSINITTLVKRKENTWDPLGEESTLIESFDYGFEVRDEWIIGYGCDDEKGHCRNYSSIYSL